jgi:hypothetical protein
MAEEPSAEETQVSSQVESSLIQQSKMTTDNNESSKSNYSEGGRGIGKRANSVLGRRLSLDSRVTKSILGARRYWSQS